MNNKINFLIVDDFSTMQKIIKDTLLGRGYTNFQMASNGSEAVTILNSSPIDIIITDWNMPVMNGLELLKQIRQNKKLSNLPVLMITAETKKENINHAIAAGVNEFMIKPFTPVTLHEKIASILSGKSPIQYVKQEDIENKAIVSNHFLNATEQPAAKKSKQKPEILVVDDLASNIDIIIGFLKDDYKVRAANNGKKALKIVESANPPDLILLDIMMPEMDGLSVCKQIKSNPLLSEIPIIFLTAKTSHDSIIEGFNAGAVDYISKPVNCGELLVRINNHLQLKFSRDELRGQVDTLMENARLRDDIERMSRHDLKTPISSIITLSSMLQERPQVKLLGEDSCENISQIESTAFLLMDLVNQSLNLYKIEMGKYDFSPEKINIKNITEKVIKDINLLADSQQVEIQILYDEQVVYCLIEELLCYSIFSNILKNALEASKKNSCVKVDIRQVEKNVFIKIHNDTMVPEAVRNVFFAKYTTHGKSQGTGIGTYSAKLLTEVQKGIINMQTDESDGTTITIQFAAA